MSKELQWEKLSSKYIIKGEWATLRADSCRMPNGKIIEPYYVLEYPNWVNVLAITENNQAIMIRQYRHGAEKTMLEIVSGVIDKTDASPEETAKRELMEETGYVLDKIEATAVVYPNPSTSGNVTHCFLATGCKKVGEQALDHSEDIEVELISVEELKKLLFDNKIPQSLHVSSIFYGLKKLGVI